MSADHDHAPWRAGARHRRPLLLAFCLVIAFMAVEVIAGFMTGSLALLSDAGHMATDALGLGMALAAITAATRTGSDGLHTYGLYRLEILAALANAVLLFAVAGYVVVEAIRRLGDPPEVLTGPMLVVAIVGLIVNLIAWRLLRAGAGESINVEGAYLEVLADLIGSLGVIAAALLVRFTGWAHADPLFAAAIGVFILPRAWRLGSRSLRVLVQAAPPDLDLDDMHQRLAAIDGVTGVHDLHIWTLTSEMDVATLHLVTREGTDPHPILDQARALLQDQFAIAHATLQVEPDTHQGCAELKW
ncbi:MAG: cation diffusion facilitator family transporter [Actinomycetota bacterium]|nr:cation diffusion facilitator family transporter [Actinomycetota bacterium]